MRVEASCTLRHNSDPQPAQNIFLYFSSKDVTKVTAFFKRYVIKKIVL